MVFPILFFLLITAASCPPDRAALNTLKDFRATAEHAVAVVKAGRATSPPIFTIDQEIQARAFYEKYLAADKLAAEAIYAGTNFSTDAVQKALLDLVTFVDLIQKKGP